MKPHQYRLAWTLLLLLLPIASWALGDLSSMLWGMGKVLLVAIVALAGFIGLLAALTTLPAQLAKPEASSRSGRWAYGLRIWLLALLAGVVAYVLGGHLFITGKLYPSLLERSLPTVVVFALSTGAGVFLWQQRPTAAKAMSAGLATAGLATLLVFHPSTLVKLKPLPRGVVGLPPIADASAPLDSFVIGETITGKLYAYVDHPPGFRGGSKALKNFVADELSYPDEARDQGIEGIVQVAFIVQASGRVINPKVTTSLSPACDAEALRLVAALAPSFTSGIKDGHPTPMELQLSFSFR